MDEKALEERLTRIEAELERAAVDEAAGWNNLRQRVSDLEGSKGESFDKAVNEFQGTLLEREKKALTVMGIVFALGIAGMLGFLVYLQDLSKQAGDVVKTQRESLTKSMEELRKEAADSVKEMLAKVAETSTVAALTDESHEKLSGLAAQRAEKQIDEFTIASVQNALTRVEFLLEEQASHPEAFLGRGLPPEYVDDVVAVTNELQSTYLPRLMDSRFSRTSRQALLIAVGGIVDLCRRDFDDASKAFDVAVSQDDGNLLIHRLQIITALCKQVVAYPEDVDKAWDATREARSEFLTAAGKDENQSKSSHLVFAMRALEKEDKGPATHRKEPDYLGAKADFQEAVNHAPTNTVKSTYHYQMAYLFSAMRADIIKQKWRPSPEELKKFELGQDVSLEGVVKILKKKTIEALDISRKARPGSLAAYNGLVWELSHEWQSSGENKYEEVPKLTPDNLTRLTDACFLADQLPQVECSNNLIDSLLDAFEALLDYYSPDPTKSGEVQKLREKLRYWISKGKRLDLVEGQPPSLEDFRQKLIRLELKVGAKKA